MTAPNQERSYPGNCMKLFPRPGTCQRTITHSLGHPSALYAIAWLKGRNVRLPRLAPARGHPSMNSANSFNAIRLMSGSRSASAGWPATAISTACTQRPIRSRMALSPRRDSSS